MSSLLDRIELKVEAKAREGITVVTLASDDVLALVNVAKAAEEAARFSRPTEAQMHALREALAVLGKEPA